MALNAPVVIPGVVISIHQQPMPGQTSWGATTASMPPRVFVNGRPFNNLSASSQQPANTGFGPAPAPLNGGLPAPYAPQPLQSPLGSNPFAQLGSPFAASLPLQQAYQWAAKEMQEAQLARMYYMNLQAASQQQAMLQANLMNQLAQSWMSVAAMPQPSFMPPSFQTFSQPLPLPMGPMGFGPGMMPVGPAGSPFAQLPMGPLPMGQPLPPFAPMMPALPMGGPLGMMPSPMAALPPSSTVGGPVPPWMQAPMQLPQQPGLSPLPTADAMNNNPAAPVPPQVGPTAGPGTGVSPFPNAVPQDQLPQLPTDPSPASPPTTPSAKEASVVSTPAVTSAVLPAAAIAAPVAAAVAQGQPVAPAQPTAPQPQAAPVAPQQQKPPVQPAAVPTASVPAKPVTPPKKPTAPAIASPVAQPPQAAPAAVAANTTPQTLEEFPLYQQLAKKPTAQLQTLLRDILSIPNDKGQINQLSDPNLYSLQTIEFILFILRNRPDAASSETYGLLKQLKDMGLVMATINDPNIEDWKKKDSEVILMEALWAGAKLDSFQPPTVPLHKLPGYSGMIEPILNGTEKVPPLILMAAVQAVSPDMFTRYNDVPKKLLTDLQDRLTQEVNNSGKRKWWTLGLGQYPTLTEEEKAIYLQTRDLVTLVLNGASLNSLPGMAPSGVPAGVATSPSPAASRNGQPSPEGMKAPLPGPIAAPGSVPGQPGQALPPMTMDELNALVATLPPEQQQAIKQMQQQIEAMPPAQQQAMFDQMMAADAKPHSAGGGAHTADVRPPIGGDTTPTPNGKPIQPQQQLNVAA